MKKVIIVLSFIFVLINFQQIYSNQISIRTQFDHLYKIWQSRVINDRWVSKGRHRFSISEFKSIIELGPRIIPIIIEKYKRGEFIDPLFAQKALNKIVQKSFKYNDDVKQSISNYINWWKTERIHNKENLKVKIKKYKIIPINIIEELENEGTMIIPEIVHIDDQNIRNIIIKLTKKFKGHELPENATRKDVMKWWKRNKDFYIIPEDTTEINIE